MTYDEMHAVAQYLYQLLDDIDTVTDIVKADDKAYRAIVVRTQAKKAAVVAECDGYTVILRPLTANTVIAASPLDITVRGWQPIETAPKDGSRILLFFPVFGNSQRQEFWNWEAQKYNKNPNPYRSGDRECVYGVMWYRDCPPTHWMPLHEAPNAEMSALLTEFQKLQDSRIAELEAELEFDQRNAAMSQAESAKLLTERDELEAQVAMLREALQAAVKVHGYTSGVLVDALNATSGT